MLCRLLLEGIFFLLSIVSIKAKEPELPLCPTNMQYFPQNLPMHCRMPGTLPPFPPQMYQNALVGKPPDPIPIPLQSMPGVMPSPIAGPLSMPMMPMPPAPAHKLPVIVMPFYSPEPSVKKPHASHQGRQPRKHKISTKKRRPKHYYKSDDYSTDTDSSTDDSTDADRDSSDGGWWKGPRGGRRSNRHHKSKRKHENKAILTPVLQYVTKDGYVIFEKQISKGEAKDWLVSKNENRDVEVNTPKNQNDPDSNEHIENKGTKFLENDVEDIEVKTEMNPHQILKLKKNTKRKPIRKHIKE